MGTPGRWFSTLAAHSSQLGLANKIPSLPSSKPEQLHRSDSGRDSVKITPGNSHTHQSGRLCSGVCLWRLLETCSLFSCSEDGLKLPTYILEKRQHSSQVLPQDLKGDWLILLGRECTAHQGKWPPPPALRRTSNSMTRSFLPVCTLPTALHVWPSMSKSFTTEISGWPFSLFVYPEETVCYRVGLLSSLKLLQDGRIS